MGKATSWPHAPGPSATGLGRRSWLASRLCVLMSLVSGQPGYFEGLVN